MRETNNEYIFRLEGRIDSSNTSELYQALRDALQDAGEEELVLDASDLNYISSAGLRLLLNLLKEIGHPLEIRNVSPEIYEIMDMTGFTEMFQVKKRIREVSVENCEIIGKGYYGTVYRLDPDTIVKVYRTPDSIPQIENERKMAKLAFVKGIPTAISYDMVKVGDSYGSVFELLKAKTLNDLLIEDPENADQLIDEFVDVLKSVHAAELDAGSVPSAKSAWLNYLDADRERGYVTDAQYDRLKELISAIPEHHNAIHGDFHMKNVMLVDGEPMLIDMDTLTEGDPVFDLQGVYMSYIEFSEDEPDNCMKFFGIDGKTGELIWQRTLESYFGTQDVEVLAGITDKVRLVAAIRFLSYFDLAKEDDPLTVQRIRHTQENIAELLERVDSLALA